MKVKKQLRWLIFLIVPFVIILTVHVVIPVTFILNSNPIFEDSYLSSKFELQQMTVRSSTLAVRLAISIFFNNLINGQRALMKLYKTSAMQTISMNASNVSVNNAYIYSQNITSSGLPLNTTENKGMWFATNYSIQEELTAEQSAMLQKFKSVQPFMDSFFIGDKGKFIYSSCLYVTNNNSQSIYFEYPSSYSQTYKQINASVVNNYYTQSLSTYSKNNQTFIVVPFVQFNNAINQSMLVLCIPQRTNSLEMVGCIRIYMNYLGQFLKDQSFFKVGIYLENILVLSNDIEGSNSVNPQIVIEFDNNNDRQYYIPLNQTFNISESNIPASTFNTQINQYNNLLYIQQKDVSTYYLTPILRFDQMITLHLITTHTYEGVNNIDSIIGQTLKQLLIPVIFLVVIAIVISYCVMNNLLNSIDKELYQLESRLKFIVDGDINIEIPYHHGTEDIKELYDCVKIINKLHRYSTQHYFRGYFTEKILKYNEALQFVKSLNYDTGNILENMGQAAMWAQQWETARQTLKESVHIQLKKMQNQFGSLDEMMPYKKVRKIPHKYKEMEVVLIRKIFKLNFVYFRYLELKQIFTHKDAAQSALDQLNFKKKQEELSKEATHYMNIQKKVFYPDYSSYSECILTLLNECKQYANLGKLQEASQLIDRTTKIIQKYNAQYSNTTKMLKEKGSKHKVLRMRNKLTTHSRSPPDIMTCFRNLFKAKITLAESKNPARFIEVLKLLVEGSRVGLFTAALTYMTVLQIRKIIVELKLNVELFQSTQIFRQSLPWKALHYGPITDDISASFLRFPTRFSPGLERQFIFIFDCNRQSLPQQGVKLRQYQMDRCVHIFEKLVKKTDRMSIIKHGTKVGVEVHCGLIFKDYNETVLKLNLNESIQERNVKKQQIGIVQAFCRAVNRIKQLKSQKIIIMFFRSVQQYREQFRRLKKKRKTKISRGGGQETFQALEVCQPTAFGQTVQQILQQDNIRNVKLIVYCANGEEHENFRIFFGLDQINKRIWSKYGGINKNNNTVYVIEEKHKPDIDRLLMLKAQFIAENHVFFL